MRVCGVLQVFRAQVGRLLIVFHHMKQIPANGYTLEKAASNAKMMRMLELLETPRSAIELAESLACAKRTANAYLAMLRAVKGTVRIGGWRRNAYGEPSPLYVLGSTPDAERPRAYTDRQKHARYIKRHPEAAVNSMMRKRAARAKPKRDALTAALFGAAHSPSSLNSPNSLP